MQRKYKLAFIAVIVLAIAIPVAFAEEIGDKEPKGVDPLDIYHPANYLPDQVDKTSVVPEFLPVSYQTVQADIPSFDLIKTVSEFLGLVEKAPAVATDKIAVVSGGDVLAVLPTDTKFRDIPIHTLCLRFSYGTDRWYQCEQEMTGV